MNEIIEKFFNIVDIINYAYPVLSPVVFGLVLLFDREKLSVKLDGVAKFLALLTIAGAVKICLWNGQMVASNPHNISLNNFLLVFLEDAFYVMVPFYITNRMSNPKHKFVVWLFFTVIFGVAHRYQGMWAIFVTATYPYFISNNFARKTSFGTVMACHFLYDCFVTFLPKLNNLFVLIDKIK